MPDNILLTFTRVLSLINTPDYKYTELVKSICDSNTLIAIQTTVILDVMKVRIQRVSDWLVSPTNPPIRDADA